MPRKRAASELSAVDQEQKSLRKRSHNEVGVEAETTIKSTPIKRRRGSSENGATENIEPGQMVEENGTEAIATSAGEETPKATPRRRGRPPKAATNGGTPTPRAGRKSVLETPTKAVAPNGLTPKRQAADRSARRKSARALIEQVVGDDSTDDEQAEDPLVREIYESSEDEEAEELAKGANGIEVDGDATAPDEAATPSQTPRRRGRPRKVRSPTPPRDLPPHELYFAHNKPGRPKTSNNTLANLALLTHEEYFDILHSHEDRHAKDIEYLESLHAESFPQWTFELLQGFSICMYGFGSKRALLRKFAKHLHMQRRHTSHRIVMVNGYAPTTTLREVLATIRSAVDPAQKIPSSQPSTMAHSIASQLLTLDMTLTIIINSIDASPLRKTGTQAVLAQLAAHPQIQLVCSADTPDFALLWDVGVRSAFNFVFHDCTTFAPYTAELDVVDETHELLGRTARRINGREGVAFVLRSLPENAKNLFRLIVGEVLIALEEEGGTAEEATGVEYRMVYNKAVEEFICSSEMAFRTLLKEFHDHQMITSSKDALGTELLSLPFRKDELETILEDLMS